MTRDELVALLELPEGAVLLEAAGEAADRPDDSCDALLCIDGIARVPDRLAALTSWARVVKPGGRILYTDPAILAGLVGSDEIAALGKPGPFALAPQGENESLIESAGLWLLRADDATDGSGADAPFRRLYDERRLARIAFLTKRPA